VLRGVDLAIREARRPRSWAVGQRQIGVPQAHDRAAAARPRRVRVLGTDITDLPEHELIETRTAVSMIFQSAALFDSLSVFENVAYPLREHRRWSEEQIAQRVAESLAAVGLPGVRARCRPSSRAACASASASRAASRSSRA
jgi:predicted ABC-type transport system involved in lysophospholipase L1 biosynthesis ATPase subunit